MNAQPSLRRGQRAFTILELFVMIGTTLVLLALVLPALNRPRRPADRIKCVNNLKNLGLAYRIFSTDHDDRFPWQTNTPASAKIVLGEEIMFYLQQVTNELSTPRILYCPSDKERMQTDSWTNFTRQNISYFVSPDADEIAPTSMMAGDRNLSLQGVQLAPGRVKIPLSTTTNLTWTAAMHEGQGNVCMGDGSVQQFSNARLREYYRGIFRQNTNGSATFFVP